MTSKPIFFFKPTILRKHTNVVEKAKAQGKMNMVVYAIPVSISPQ